MIVTEMSRDMNWRTSAGACMLCRLINRDVVHLLLTTKEELRFGQQGNMSVIKTPEKIRYDVCGCKNYGRG